MDLQSLPLLFGAIGLIVVISLIVKAVCPELQGLTKDELVKQLEEFFSGREKLSDEAFFLTYFEGQGIPKEIPIGVRRIFEEHFDAEFSRIKSTDDFSQEMRFIWGYDSMVDVEIVMALEDEFGVTIPNAAAEKMTTIQGIVEEVWKLKQAG